jgi:hypothetical protein
MARLRNDFNRDFSIQTVRGLKKKGMVLYGRTFIPGRDKSYMIGEPAYLVDDNGTSKVMKFLEVLEESGQRSELVL